MIIIADKTTEDVGAVIISALKGVVTNTDGAGVKNVKVSLVAYKKILILVIFQMQM